MGGKYPTPSEAVSHYIEGIELNVEKYEKHAKTIGAANSANGSTKPYPQSTLQLPLCRPRKEPSGREFLIEPFQ